MLGNYRSGLETPEARKSRFLAIGVAKELKKNPVGARSSAELYLQKLDNNTVYSRWGQKWRKILASSTDQEIISLLVSKGSADQDLPSLRQMSPFVGIVSSKDRNKRLKKWKKITSGI